MGGEQGFDAGSESLGCVSGLVEGLVKIRPLT